MSAGIKVGEKAKIVYKSIYTPTGSFYQGEIVEIKNVLPAGNYIIKSLDGLKEQYVGDFEVEAIKE